MTQEEIKEAYFQTIDDYFKEHPNEKNAEEKSFSLRQLKSIEVGDTIVFTIGVCNYFQEGMCRMVLNNVDFDFALIKKLGSVCKFRIELEQLT